MDTFLTICYAAICTLAFVGVVYMVVPLIAIAIKRKRDKKRGYIAIDNNPLIICLVRNRMFVCGVNLVTWSNICLALVAVFNVFCSLFS